jgi:hypothetical protein
MEIASKSNKRRKMLNKMLEISSIPREIKRVLGKVLRRERGMMEELDYSILGRYLRNIYDQDYVRKTIEILKEKTGEMMEFEKGCEMLQVFIVSETEREYVTKVKKKLIENEEMEKELKKAKKSLENGMVRKGQLGHQRGEVEKKMEFEVKNYENKLEKANQKLNLSITKNKELRKKINLMRKEKNIIQKIYE